MTESAVNRIVRDGYNVIAPRYHAGRVAEEQATIEWLDALRSRVPASGRVIDLGCGSGVPITRYFAQRGYEVDAYDLSPAMLDIGRTQVPGAIFHEARIEDVRLEANSVDIVVSFFAIIHVPRDEHAALFRRIWTWLKPGGALFVSLGTSDNPSDHDENWHGAPMAWSHFDAKTSLSLLREAGFRIDWSEIQESQPHERHLYVIAAEAAGPGD